MKLKSKRSLPTTQATPTTIPPTAVSTATSTTSAISTLVDGQKLYEKGKWYTVLNGLKVPDITYEERKARELAASEARLKISEERIRVKLLELEEKKAAREERKAKREQEQRNMELRKERMLRRQLGKKFDEDEVNLQEQKCQMWLGNHLYTRSTMEELDEIVREQEREARESMKAASLPGSPIPRSYFTPEVIRDEARKSKLRKRIQSLIDPSKGYIVYECSHAGKLSKKEEEKMSEKYNVMVRVDEGSQESIPISLYRELYIPGTDQLKPSTSEQN